MRKKPLKRKLADAFIGADIQDVRSFLVWECLLPAVKYAILDSILMLFGEGPARRRLGQTTQTSTVNYGGYSSLASPAYGYGRSPARPQVNSRYACDDLIYERESDAREVLDLLIDRIVDTGAASVADAYDLSGFAVGDFTMNNWGWRDLSMADIRRVRDGWIITFPRTVNLR